MPSIQAQIINLLEDLRERLKIAFMFIAHDLNVVRHISDRIAVMYLGEIVEIAKTETLFEHPRTRTHAGCSRRSRRPIRRGARSFRPWPASCPTRRRLPPAAASRPDARG